MPLFSSIFLLQVLPLITILASVKPLSFKFFFYIGSNIQHTITLTPFSFIRNYLGFALW